MRTFAYLAACVIVPAVWGILSVWMFRRFERRRRPETRQQPPPADYSI